MTLTNAMIGSPVFTQDGDQIGTVKEVRGTGFKIDAPMAPDYWLSEDCLQSSQQGQVRLSIAQSEVDSYKIDEPDSRDYPVDRAGMTDRTPTTDRTAPSMGRTEETERLRLHEEELRARTRPVEAGEVRVTKEVIEEEQQLEVPVRHEEVTIERRPVDRPATEADFREQEIRVPVQAEEVEVEKQAVVREEVEIGKRAVQETEHLSDTVRREEARIEREGQVPVHGETTATGPRTWSALSPQYRQTWQSRYGATGGRWEEAEPYYRYGYEMSDDPRYQGKRWSEIEPELRRDYGAWGQRHGYPADDSAWERFQDQVRESWEDARGQRRAA